MTMPRTASLWRPLLTSAAALLCALPALALQITDDRGIKVQIDQTPQRIVSLLPSLTETVCALGQCQRLVGVDRYSNYPDSVATLPKVGGGLDPSLEAVVALKPDLVLIATSSPAGARLRALGIKVVALEPKSYEDLHRVLDTVARLLDVANASIVWQQIEGGVAAAARSLPARVKGARVYFEVNAAPYAASESSFIGETLTRLGVKNVVAGSLGPFPKINPEFVVRADPDVIMVGDATFVGIAQRPGWAKMRAIRDNHVCVFTPAQSDVMVRPGPRMAEAARDIAQCLKQNIP